MIKIPDKKVRIIECENMEFAGKDIIKIKNLDDFLWLLQDDKCVYKLGEFYYILSGEVA